MKFNIQQTELNTALQHLVRNTDNKFFADIKLTTGVNSLVLQATNGEVSMEYRLQADTTDTDTILINARKFTDIVSRLSGDITFEDGVIKAGKSKLKIDLKRDEGYQFINTIEADTITLNIKELQTGIKNRLFACDTLSQNVLSGVCLNKDKIVTCNGNMLALYRLNEQLPFDTVILGNKLCQEILKCFNDETVQISMTNNKVMLKSDKITLVGSLLQGSYPNYKVLIPQPRYNVKFVKNEILKTLDIIKLTTDKNICYFNFDGDKLTIGTKDGSSEIDIKYNNEPMKIWFNINYMSDCLKNISSDIVNFGFIAPLNACIIEAGNEKTLIMPVKNS